MTRILEITSSMKIQLQVDEQEIGMIKRITLSVKDDHSRRGLADAVVKDE